MEERIEQLKGMHEIMKNSSDEDIYCAWIYVVPDEPSESDFESIAEDDEAFEEVFSLFYDLYLKRQIKGAQAPYLFHRSAQLTNSLHSTY